MIFPAERSADTARREKASLVPRFCVCCLHTITKLGSPRVLRSRPKQEPGLANWFKNDFGANDRSRCSLDTIWHWPRFNRQISGVSDKVSLPSVGIAPAALPVTVDDSHQEFIGMDRLSSWLRWHDHNALISGRKENVRCVLNRPVREWIIERSQL